MYLNVLFACLPVRLGVLLKRWINHQKSRVICSTESGECWLFAILCRVNIYDWPYIFIFSPVAEYGWAIWFIQLSWMMVMMMTMAFVKVMVGWISQRCQYAPNPIWTCSEREWCPSTTHPGLTQLISHHDQVRDIQNEGVISACDVNCDGIFFLALRSNFMRIMGNMLYLKKGEYVIEIPHQM